MGEEEQSGTTWAQVAAAVQRLAIQRREWGGYPVPIEDLRLCLEPTHPMRGQLEGFKVGEDTTVTERLTKDVADDELIVNVRNTWYSLARQQLVFVCEFADGKVRKVTSYRGSEDRLRLSLNSFSPCFVWDAKAEARAMEKLSGMIGDWKYKLYLLTGQFLETSERSGVTYLFRRLRPTVAFRHKDDGWMRILACLCMHPVGYYEASFSGAMVPTDDVIAHLCMMRGDERRYWAVSNQHTPHEAEAGL